MKDAPTPVAPHLSWRRILELLSRPPPLPVTPEQFAAIQARVWERLSHKLASLSPSCN